MSLSACWRGRRTYILLRYKCSPIIDSQLNRHQSQMRGKMKENPNPRGEVISWKTTFCVGHEISISFGDFFKMVPPQETQIPLWMRRWNTGKVIVDFVNSPCLKLRKNLRQEFRCPSQRLSDSSMLKPSAVCPDNGWVFFICTYIRIEWLQSSRLWTFCHSIFFIHVYDKIPLDALREMEKDAANISSYRGLSGTRMQSLHKTHLVQSILTTVQPGDHQELLSSQQANSFKHFHSI